MKHFKYGLVLMGFEIQQTDLSKFLRKNLLAVGVDFRMVARERPWRSFRNKLVGREQEK